MSYNRRPMGSGSIEWRVGKDGRKRGRVKVYFAGKHETIGTVDSKEEGDLLIAATLERLASERTAPTGVLTLRDWGKTWFKQRARGGVVRSTSDDESRWKTHIEHAPFIDTALDAITRPMIVLWIPKLMNTLATRPGRNGKNVVTGRKISRHTAKRAITVLNVALRDALDLGLINNNPAAGHELPSAQYTDEYWTYLTLDEIQKVIGCKKIPEWERLVFTIAIFTGMRRGEIWGLRRCDVYVDHVTPHVIPRRSYANAPKNGKHKMLPLLGQAREAFERLIALAGGEQKWNEQPEALIFPSLTGGVRRKSDDAGWRSQKGAPGYKALAGIKRKVRFHDLRHTCASQLLMGGWGRAWRIEDVSAFLRHSSITVTMRYAHLAHDYLHAAAAATVMPSPSLVPTSSPALSAKTLKRLELRSHLRDLNPRPTVYETQAEASEVARLGRRGNDEGAFDLAAAVLERVRDGHIRDPELTKFALDVFDGFPDVDSVESEVG